MNRKAANGVNEFFIYKADRKDEHLLLSPSDPAGDCEDYALTVLYYMRDKKRKKMKRWLKKGRAAIVFCIDPYGQKHNVLRVGQWYIDNQLKRWVDKDELLKRGYKKLSETHPGTVWRRIRKGGRVESRAGAT